MSWVKKKSMTQTRVKRTTGRMYTMLFIWLYLVEDIMKMPQWGRQPWWGKGYWRKRIYWTTYLVRGWTTVRYLSTVTDTVAHTWRSRPLGFLNTSGKNIDISTPFEIIGRFFISIFWLMLSYWGLVRIYWGFLGLIRNFGPYWYRYCYQNSMDIY